MTPPIVRPIAASGFDVVWLCPLVTAIQEDNENRSDLAEVDAVARTVVNLQLHDAFTDWLTLAKIAKLYTRQPSIDTGLGLAIPQRGEPFSKRRFSIRRRVILHPLLAHRHI
jgi:hypothetical protein